MQLSDQGDEQKRISAGGTLACLAEPVLGALTERGAHELGGRTGAERSGLDENR